MKKIIATLFLILFLGLIFSLKVEAYECSGCYCPSGWSVHSDYCYTGSNGTGSYKHCPVGTCGSGECAGYDHAYAPHCVRYENGILVEEKCANNWGTTTKINGKCRPLFNKTFNSNTDYFFQPEGISLCSAGTLATGDNVKFRYANVTPNDVKIEDVIGGKKRYFPEGKYGEESKIVWRCNGQNGGNNVDCAALRDPEHTYDDACNYDAIPREYPRSAEYFEYFINTATSSTKRLCKVGNGYSLTVIETGERPEITKPTTNKRRAWFPTGKYGESSRIGWVCTGPDGDDGSFVQECSVIRTNDVCGTAAMSFNVDVAPATWSLSTANYFCKNGTTLTPNTLPTFPVPGGSPTTWRCNDASGVGTNCTATNSKVITGDNCGTGAIEFINQYSQPAEWSLSTANYFCKNGTTLTPNTLPTFPLTPTIAGASVSWRCNNASGVGTDCSAKNIKRDPVCSSSLEDQVKTLDQLKALSDTDMCGEYGRVKRNADGTYKIRLDDINWKWDCVLESDPTKPEPPVICSAKNCLATDLSEQLFVQFNRLGLVPPARMSIAESCDVCCTYTNDGNVVLDICGGQTGEINITSHPQEMERICTSGTGTGTGTVTVQCVCTANKCTARGTCAMNTAVIARSKDDANCSSDCSSDSDCSGGGRNPRETN